MFQREVNKDELEEIISGWGHLPMKVLIQAYGSQNKNKAIIRKSGLLEGASPKDRAYELDGASPKDRAYEYVLLWMNTLEKNLMVMPFVVERQFPEAKGDAETLVKELINLKKLKKKLKRILGKLTDSEFSQFFFSEQVKQVGEKLPIPDSTTIDNLILIVKNRINELSEARPAVDRKQGRRKAKKEESILIFQLVTLVLYFCDISANGCYERVARFLRDWKGTRLGLDGIRKRYLERKRNNTITKPAKVIITIRDEVQTHGQIV